MAENVLEVLNSEFPGRKTQIEEICEYIPENGDSCIRPTFPHILLCGLAGSGRSSILLKYLKFKKLDYFLVYCIHSRIEKSLSAQLLHGLHSQKCDETCEEIESLNAVINYYLKETERKETLRCIIFKGSEYLAADEIQQLAIFQEILLQNGWYFSFIFISSDDKNLIQLHRSCVTIFFPRYTTDQFIEILLKKFSGIDQELYRSFLKVFLPAITPVFSDLYDVQKLVRKYYEIYKKPVEDGVISGDNVGGLSRSILSSLKISSVDMLYDFPKKEHQTDKNVANLAYAGKVLLVAAFLCSFIPKSEDKKYFCKMALNKKKKVKSKSAYDIKLGPKSFSFQRLLAVYQAVGDMKPSLNLALISEVASLVEQKLIVPVGSTRLGNLNEPIYKCLADFDTVLATAKNIDIDLGKYVEL